MAKIGEILCELREDKGLTQKELANIFHISGSSISAYELGTRLPNIEVLLAYVNYFDVSADNILGLSKHPNTLSSINEEFISGNTVGDIIEDAKTLTEEQKEALLIVLRSMSFYSEIKTKTSLQDDRNK